MKTVVIISWYFNPIHPWHIEYMQLAKALWDELWVIINNDKQAQKKTGKEDLFQTEDVRMKIVNAIRYVDEVFLSIDNDLSVSKSIKSTAEMIYERYWKNTKIIFWNWGDRKTGKISENTVCEECNIIIKHGLWEKIDNSSSYRKKVA